MLDTTESAQLLPGKYIIGMAGQAGIVDASHGRVLFRELGDAFPVLALPAEA